VVVVVVLSTGRSVVSCDVLAHIKYSYAKREQMSNNGWREEVGSWFCSQTRLTYDKRLTLLDKVIIIICRFHQERHHAGGTFQQSLLFCRLRIGHVVVKELSTFLGLFFALDRWVSMVVARVVGPQD
jgi:hypothetical protein